MVNNHDVMNTFVLKPSQLSIGFQSVILVLMAMIFYFSVGIIFAGILILCAIVAMFVFKSRAQVAIFEHLDQNRWSIQYKNNPVIGSVILRNVIDHHFYIACYFEEKKPSSLIIWRDQVELKQWKYLKTYAKLN